MSCRILQLLTIASVPFVGDESSLISFTLCVTLLFKIVSSFLTVVYACSSMSLYSFSKSLSFILLEMLVKINKQNLRHNVERAKCFAVIDFVFIFPNTTAPA